MRQIDMTSIFKAVPNLQELRRKKNYYHNKKEVCARNMKFVILLIMNELLQSLLSQLRLHLFQHKIYFLIIFWFDQDFTLLPAQNQKQGKYLS